MAVTANQIEPHLAIKRTMIIELSCSRRHAARSLSTFQVPHGLSERQTERANEAPALISLAKPALEAPVLSRATPACSTVSYSL